MANPKIKVKRSSVEGKVPAVSQLERGELAVNSYDGKIYILQDQFSVGIATTTHTVNPWNEPNGVGAGISYSGDTLVSGVSTFADNITVQKHLKFGDSPGGTENLISFGAGGDLNIFHSGNGSFIRESGTGPLTIMTNEFLVRNSGNNEQMINASENSSVKLFFNDTKRLETTGSGVNITDDLGVSGVSTFNGITNVTGEVNIGDSATGSSSNRLRIGDDADIQIYRDSSTTNNHLIAQNGLFYISNNNLRFTAANTSKPIIQGNVDADVKLYYAANEKLATTPSGVDVTGGLGVSGVSTFSGGVKLDGSNADFDDDVKIRMGDSQDLLIFHQESNGNSIIREQGGGVLSLQTNGPYMNIWDSTNQQTIAQFNTAGACQFRHDGTIRLKTTSSGAEVVGTLETDALTVGNYNMPTTVGAQDTVLKSDGTNVVFGSAASATFTEEGFTATQGQTVFTASSSLPTYIQVFVNGIKLRPTSDFTKSGTQLTLVSAATAGDEIDIVRFD